MAKKRVYVETSVISCLASRPARDLKKLVIQQATWDWWEQRHRWELYTSPMVLQEIEQGDTEAARVRIAYATKMIELPESNEVRELADKLIAAGLIPPKVFADAMHIASAAVHGMDYLITWNQKHIFNPFRIEAIYAAIRQSNWIPPVLLRPDNLLEKDHDD